MTAWKKKQKVQPCRKKHEILQAKHQEVLDSEADEANELFLRRRIAEVYTLAGQAYLAKGETGQAEADFRAAAALDPDNGACRQSLAMLCEQQGRLKESLETVRQIKELLPDSSLVFFRLGELERRLGDFDAAEEALANVCRLAPRQAVGYASLARLYLQMGRKLKEARQVAAVAAQMEPTAGNFSTLAASCERVGDVAAARQALERALALEPNNPQYREMQQALDKRK